MMRTAVLLAVAQDETAEEQRLARANFRESSQAVRIVDRLKFKLLPCALRELVNAQRGLDLTVC